jgi:hypothetical protein
MFDNLFGLVGPVFTAATLFVLLAMTAAIVSLASRAPQFTARPN